MADGDVLEHLVTALSGGDVEVVDLSQPLHPGTPILKLPDEFAQSPPFSIESISRFDERGPYWYWNKFACGEHTGTHFDAPIHWISGKDHDNNATDTIPVHRFIGPAFVIDVTGEVDRDPDFLLTPEHIRAWEEKHGEITPDSWVLVRTGWSKKPTAEDFLNMHEDGAHTPGFAAETPTFLAEERKVLGVGVETVGTDAGQAGNLEPMFPCHYLMHGANRYGLASLANLDRLPPTGAVVIAPPLKIVEGSGSPTRVLALVPKGG